MTPIGALKLVVEIIETLRAKNLSYEAGWTDSFCHRRCMHEHLTLIEAAECGMPHGAGWYVFAIENGKPRQLQQNEDDVVNRLRFKAAYENTERVLGDSA